MLLQDSVGWWGWKDESCLPEAWDESTLWSLQVSMDGTLLPRGWAAPVAGYPVRAPLVALLTGFRDLPMALPS